MKVLIGLLIASTLALGSGCAKQDWIDRTLVTVDVTGTWYGSVGTSADSARYVWLELTQEGAKVTGFMRVTPVGSSATGGSLDGTVAGDMFSFRLVRGNVDGELKISGDQMDGLWMV